MSQQKWRRFGFACGIAYVVLAILGSDVLAGRGEVPGLDATQDRIGSYVANNPTTAQEWAGGYIEVLALLFFICFLASLWSFLRQAEGGNGVLATTAFGAGLVSVAVKFAGFPAAAALSLRASDGVDSQLAAALLDMNNFSFVLTGALGAVLLLASAAIVIQTMALPRWLGWSAVVIAFGLLAGVATATSGAIFLPTLLYLVWVVVASVILFRTKEDATVAAGGHGFSTAVT